MPQFPHTARSESAAKFLLKALRARTPEEREQLAGAGLARQDAEEDDDAEMEALLLRQVYLAQVERGDYLAALRVAEEMVELAALGDIARQDAARAAAALGEVDVAAGHLKMAARVCPASRRAFHLATLGALLRFSGRTLESLEAFEDAVHYASKDLALCRAQLALAQRAAGRSATFDLTDLRGELESAEFSNGYALWVLGELCTLLGDETAGRDYLTRFLARMQGAPQAKALALAGEMSRAQALLARSG